MQFLTVVVYLREECLARMEMPTNEEQRCQAIVRRRHLYFSHGLIPCTHKVETLLLSFGRAGFKLAYRPSKCLIGSVNRSAHGSPYGTSPKPEGLQGKWVLKKMISTFGNRWGKQCSALMRYLDLRGCGMKHLRLEEREMAHLYERRRFPYPGDKEAVEEFILKGGMLGTTIGPKGTPDSEKDGENFQKKLQSQKFDQEAKKLWSRMKSEVIQELQEKGFEVRAE
ncbi:hypothetical protein IEQ34_001539 [Dendrobium chrysotoxum]|uniref:Uncharacterized protein n=1 Tax=Dendrobium chrysotoxum TaxID=161865 RepID=A0AAV7HLJ1_DENCH|nr:hypothetical protein IEQ34_001539 [Dendrobium chrysotoxum]